MSTPATRKCVVSNDDDNNEILSRVMTGILTFINNSEIFVKNDLIQFLRRSRDSIQNGGDTVVCIHTKNEGRDKFENNE